MSGIYWGVLTLHLGNNVSRCMCIQHRVGTQGFNKQWANFRRWMEPELDLITILYPQGVVWHLAPLPSKSLPILVEPFHLHAFIAITGYFFKQWLAEQKVCFSHSFCSSDLILPFKYLYSSKLFTPFYISATTLSISIILFDWQRKSSTYMWSDRKIMFYFDFFFFLHEMWQVWGILLLHYLIPQFKTQNNCLQKSSNL